MNPLMVAFLQVLIEKGPDIAFKIIQLVQKQNPTTEDLIALLNSFSDKSYDDYMKEAGVLAAGG
jgi:hypothetical protein